MRIKNKLNPHIIPIDAKVNSTKFLKVLSSFFGTILGVNAIPTPDKISPIISINIMTIVVVMLLFLSQCKRLGK